MSYRQFIANKSLPILQLDEKLKINQFTFGFELEAIYNPTNRPVPANAPKVEVDKDTVMTRLKKLEPILKLKSKFGGSYTRDGSIKANDLQHTPFEFVSGVLQFTDANILKFMEAMKEFKNQGVYTNESCGFHIHFGFPDTTRKQLLWIKTVYLFDSVAQDHFEYFQSTHGPIPFWSARFASVGNKKKLRADLGELVKLWKRTAGSTVNQKIDNYFSQDYFISKYNVLGIHEKYRTLEWRGPRGFLATGNPQDIVAFVKAVRRFVKWLSSAEDTESVVIDPKRGIVLTRETFYEMITHSDHRIKTFGVDVAERIDKATSDAQRAAIAFEYFRGMNIYSRSATNYRKIANRIKTRYPEAWRICLARIDKTASFPEKAKMFLSKVARHLHLPVMEEQTNIASFRQYRDESV